MPQLFNFPAIGSSPRGDDFLANARSAGHLWVEESGRSRNHALARECFDVLLRLKNFKRAKAHLRHPSRASLLLDRKAKKDSP